MNPVKLLTISFLFFFNTFHLSAGHITGGSMTYECLGNNEFEITMVLFRDCLGNATTFDSPAPITIYINDVDVYQTVNIGRNLVEVIEPIECLGSPSAYCSEKAVYKFTTTLIPDASFRVAYQRCCWSESIDNMLEPTERGITVSTNISAEAIELCNTQPIINTPLSISVCQGEFTEIPIDAIDPDGDSLVYELCFPLAGGGVEGTATIPGSPTSCQGIAPNPACPPPYAQLPFNPSFDINNPFPASDQITLNADDGTLSFTPSTIGRYVFAICVSEIRAAQTLSVSMLNMQITSGLPPLSQNNIETNSWEVTTYHTQRELFFTSNSPSKNGVINIFDISGKMALSKNIGNANETTISTRNLNAGIYFATLNTNSFYKTFKVIIH